MAMQMQGHEFARWLYMIYIFHIKNTVARIPKCVTSAKGPSGPLKSRPGFVQYPPSIIQPARASARACPSAGQGYPVKTSNGLMVTKFHWIYG